MFKWLKNVFGGATEVAAGAVGHIPTEVPYKVETPVQAAPVVKETPAVEVKKTQPAKKPATKKPAGQSKGRPAGAKPKAQPAKAKKPAPKKA
jgi:hypothetical protein